MYKPLHPPPPNPSCPSCLYWLRAAAANQIIRRADGVTTLSIGECADIHRRAQAGEYDDLMNEMMNPIGEHNGTPAPEKKPETRADC